MTIRFNIDADPENADWIKKQPDFPMNTQEEFETWLDQQGLALTEWLQTPAAKVLIEGPNAPYWMMELLYQPTGEVVDESG